MAQGEEVRLSMLALVRDVLLCLLGYVHFLVPTISFLLAVHFFLKVPHEVFRKLLHAVAFASTPVMMHAATSWQVTVATLVLVGLAAWPVLAFAERFSWYPGLFEQRRTHEVRQSLLVLVWGDALIVAWCWGLCRRPDVAVASILMWGFGDAAAALVGQRLGTHHIMLPLADHKKTWEGSAAMCCTELAVGLALLGPKVAVLVAALAGAYVELITHRGYDTITVPVANAAVLLLLL